MESITMPYGLPTPEEEHPTFLLPTDLRLEQEGSRKTLKQQIPNVSRLHFGAFDSHDELVSSVLESMKQSGGCIIEGMMPLEVLDSVENDVRPYLDKVKTADCKYSVNR
jgi:hypothetical protein